MDYHSRKCWWPQRVRVAAASETSAPPLSKRKRNATSCPLFSVDSAIYSLAKWLAFECRELSAGQNVVQDADGTRNTWLWTTHSRWTSED